MAMGLIRTEHLTYEAFIYEGEKLAVEYPSGDTVEIPKHRVHAILLDRLLPSGEPCSVVPLKTPLTRLDIVVLDE